VIDQQPFVERLRAAKELGAEDNHEAADSILLDALRALGADDIVIAYEALKAGGDWWYA
jgi:hypothetical protein